MAEPETKPDTERLLRFFGPDPSCARDQIAAAAAHLAAYSAGEVTRPELIGPRGRPERAGPLCARIFGPLEDDTCLCGFVRQDPSRRGTTCPKCDVPIGPTTLRDERWGHVALAWPLLHPALVRPLTALLGWTEAELRAVLGFEAAVQDDLSVKITPDGYEDLERVGPDALARAVEARGSAGEWLVSLLPVVPPGLRPLGLPQDPAAGRLAPRWPCVAGPENRALGRLVLRNQRLRRLLELAAPDIIITNEVRLLQAAFEETLGIFALPADHPARRLDAGSLWCPLEAEADPFCFPGAPPEIPLGPTLRLNGAPPVSPPEERRYGLDAPLAPGRPRGLCFVGDHEVVLQLGYALLRLGLGDGSLHFAGPATEYRLFGAFGERLIFGDPYGRRAWEGALAGAAVLDLGAECWLEEYPTDLPATYLEGDEPEDGWLCDWHGRRMAPADPACSGDRPTEVTRSPDHRFLWVSSGSDDGTILSAGTAEPNLYLGALALEAQSAPVLGWGGLAGDPVDGNERFAAEPAEGFALDGEERNEDGSDAEESEAVALARGPDRLWRLLDAWCGVSVDGEVRFRLPFVPAAAAFTPDGRRLAAANQGWLVVVDVDAPAILRTFDLRLLGAALGAERPAGLPALAWDLLLATFGTPAAALSQVDGVLLRIPGVGKARLEALRRHAAPALPPRLP